MRKARRASFRKIKDGEEVFVPRNLKQQVACCDCGLVHRYEYSILIGGKAMNLPKEDFLAFARSLKLRLTKRAWRDEPATKRRRHAAGRA